MKGVNMENEQKFIEEFVAAAKAEDGEKMKTVSEEVTKLGLTQRTELLEKLVKALEEAEVNEEITAGLGATLELMRSAQEAEANKDSAVEDAKDEGSTAEEATQDVAADDSASEDKADKPESEEEGDAPAKEEEAEKEKSE
nr:hypothetical protein 12 [Gammaproteobacteria bacterium]